MEILTVGEVMERVVKVGGSLKLEGKRVALTLPQDCPPDTEAAIVETIRANRDAVSAILGDTASEAPSVPEVRASLPPGVKLVRYEPKQAPFAVAPVSVVTNSGKFYRSYLADLSRRLARPECHHCPPLAARGGNGSFRGGEHSVVGRLRERLRRGERFERVGRCFPS
jgi:hypothetical protein